MMSIASWMFNELPDEIVGDSEPGESWICQACGEPLMEVSHGVVCSGSHCSERIKGGLRIPKDVKQKNYAMIAIKAKPAIYNPVKRCWFVRGDSTHYRKKQRINRVLSAWPKDVPRSDVIAYCAQTFHVIWLEKKGREQ